MSDYFDLLANEFRAEAAEQRIRKLEGVLRDWLGTTDADDHVARYDTSDYDECDACGFEWPCPLARARAALGTEETQKEGGE